MPDPIITNPESLKNFIEVITVAKLLLAALLTFWFNKKLNKNNQKNQNRVNMILLTNELAVIHNHLICMYKEVITRESTISLIETFSKQVTIRNPAADQNYLLQKLVLSGFKNEEDLVALIKSIFDFSYSQTVNDILSKQGLSSEHFKQIVLGSFRSEMKFDHTPLYQGIFDTEICFTTDLQSLSFLEKYNVNILTALISLRHSIGTLNEVIKGLTKYIDKSADKESRNNTDMVISVNKNLIKQLNCTLAFSNIAQELMVKYGRQIFKNNFRIQSLEYTNYNDSKFVGELPNGWEYLRKDPIKAPLSVRFWRKFWDLVW